MAVKIIEKENGEVVTKSSRQVRKEKLIARFRSRPKDFTFDEAVTLLSYFGYQLSNKGKTSGSRVEFVEKTTGHVIGFHKPHPGNVLKPYVMDQISDQLESRGLI